MEKSFETENNIPVYSYLNPNLHSFCICLYLKAGMLYETDRTNGITHFWEHMVFRNIDGLMGHTLYQQLDKLGLTMNGSTYKELVQFKITGAVKHFSAAVDIFMKLFEPMQVPSSDIQVERKRIKAEIREDDDKGSLDYFSNKIVWEGTILEKTIAGTSSVLDRIGVQALQQIHRENLSVNNLFLYVTGCVSDFELAQFYQRIGKIPLGITVNTRDNLAPIPSAFFHRHCHVAVKNCSYTCVRYSFDFSTDRYTQAELDYLYAILFEGDSSKILKKLSDETGYIYSYDARIEKYSNIGCLYFLYEVQLSNLMDSIRQVTQILSLLKTGITDELEYVKAIYIDNSDFLLDNDEDLNWNFAYECHIMNSRYPSIEQRRRLYSLVTPERIAEIAQEIFQPDNLVLTLKGNKKRIKPEEIQAILQTL